MTHGLQPYIGVFVDLGVKVQHGRIHGDDVVFPDAVSLLVVQVEQEVLLCNPDIHGGAREPHGLFDDAVCEQRRKTINGGSQRLQLFVSTRHRRQRTKDGFQHQTRWRCTVSCAAQV